MDSVSLVNSWRNLLNSSSRKISLSVSATGSDSAKSSRLYSRGTFVAMVARRLLNVACSPNCARASISLFLGSCSRFARRFSRVSYSLINATAVFSPIPGTPGMLSIESPARPITSVICSGLTPYRSTTSPLPKERSFMVSRVQICSSTSCSISLSPVTMTTSNPFFATSLAMVPMTSSAS